MSNLEIKKISTVNVLFLVASFFIFFPAVEAHSEVKFENGLFYHESSNRNAIENILEDIIPILNTDLAKYLTDNLDYLKANSHFNLPPNASFYKTIKKNRFMEKYRNLKFDEENKDILSFIRLIKDSLYVCMSESNDLMNRKFKKNIINFNNSFNNVNSKIEHQTNINSTYISSVNKIYSLKLKNKKNIYSDLIKSISDLFNVLWWESYGSGNETPYASFTRRHAVFKNLKSAKGLEDYTNFGECLNGEMSRIIGYPRGVGGFGALFLLNEARAHAALVCGPMFGKKVTITHGGGNDYKRREMERKIDDIHQKLR